MEFCPTLKMHTFILHTKSTQIMLLCVQPSVCGLGFSDIFKVWLFQSECMFILLI